MRMLPDTARLERGAFQLTISNYRSMFSPEERERCSTYDISAGRETDDSSHRASGDAAPKRGEWRREVYPWNDKEPDRFSVETLAVLNAAMAKCSSKAELRVVELPILQRDLSFRGDGDRLSDKHLGVFAKDDIFLGETFFSEASPLTVVADPENSSLCEYCGGALKGHYEVCDECWEGDEDSGVMWCSVTCREKAFER